MPVKILKAIASVDDFASYDSSFADLLIVDDAARTSGNTFQWLDSGTPNGGTVYAGSTGAWHMMFSGPANVKWYGAKGDGTNDDSAAIQATLDNHASIYIPATGSSYRCNVIARGQSIFGEKTVKIGYGVDRSVLQSYTDGGFALHLGPHDLWDYVPVNDIWLAGGGVSGGIQFDNFNAVGAHDLAGRWVLNCVTFNNCITAVKKPYGNIGNTFNSCCFNDGQYHYHAVSVLYDMHTGCDTFNSCEFNGASIACIYINQDYFDCGQHTFNECVFQKNPGFVFFIPRYGYTSRTTFRIENSWMEPDSNATSPSVVIDGVSYTPYEFYFAGVSPILISGTTINSIYTTNSTVFFENCQMGILVAEASRLNFSDTKIGANTFNVDSSTAVYATGGTRNGSNDSSIIYGTPPINFEGETPNGFWIRMKPRTSITNRYSDNVLVAETFNTSNTYYFGPSANRVKDGTSSATCVEVRISSSASVLYGHSAVFLDATSVSKYLVWIYDIKRISGAAPSVGLRDIVAYAADWLLEIPIGEWVTVGGCAKVNGYSLGNPAGFLIKSNDAVNDTVVRVGGMSFLLLDTEQQAIEALASGELFVSNAENVTMEGTQSPGTAPVPATWNVGDRCVNSAPAVGDPKSWVCTVAGTPGTWVSEGNL